MLKAVAAAVTRPLNDRRDEPSIPQLVNQLVDARPIVSGSVGGATFTPEVPQSLQHLSFHLAPVAVDRRAKGCLRHRGRGLLPRRERGLIRQLQSKPDRTVVGEGGFADLNLANQVSERERHNKEIQSIGPLTGKTSACRRSPPF